MVYKGCILKIEKQFAVVVTPGMEYFKIIKKENMSIGSQIMFIKEDLYKENTGFHRKMTMVAAVLMVMILSMAILGKVNPSNYIVNAAAVVSVDINPSIELEIDGAMKVTKIIPVNKEGRLLMDEEMVGLAIDEAVWRIIENGKIKKFITTDKKSVLISTVILREDQLNKESIMENIDHRLEEEHEPLNILYMDGNKEDLEDARKSHISIGKYGVFKDAGKNDKKMTIDQVKNMKVQEMVDKKILKIEEKAAKPNKNKKEEKKQEKENHGEDLPPIKQEEQRGNGKKDVKVELQKEKKDASEDKVKVKVKDEEKDNQGEPLKEEHEKKDVEKSNKKNDKKEKKDKE